MKNELDKAYNPAQHEDHIYQLWEKSGHFNPDNLDVPNDAPTYTIVLPPPNITDKLHIGHAATVAIEDLLIRYHRLRGYRTLWLPGTDHAAIATQNVVEKKLLKEKGQTRHDLGRESFLDEVGRFVESTQAIILKQIKKLGASLDWSRLAFTLDEPRQLAVRTMFHEMYEAGAIYRGERIVNWCPRCHSTLADDEVDYKEEKAKLYWIKYGPFVLATSRPETKLGDTAVAVYPGDKRYAHLVGKEIEVEGVLGKFRVQVVADHAVDPEFGSGAIKVTPAHSFIDNEIAGRHNLPGKKIIDEDGRMMANCGKYAGLSTREAREAIVADMEKLGLIDHIDENYSHNAAVCYRCGTVIEPLPSKQWFIAVDKPLERLGGLSLKQKALEAAKSGAIKFIPDRFLKRYLDWMENLHDWCISRQIWFGHRIPVWYRGDEVYVGTEAPTEPGWEQDPDTLDTWFSSGMWTFSTLGWPTNFTASRKLGDLDRFHPTQVLETGYEIITLWVSRMIMMSFFALGEIPFSRVYLHGIILDEKGKKMSKSKGNGVDPLDMIEKYGADATRLSLLMGSTPGNDARFSEEKLAAKRNFANKLWNISRFVLSVVPEEALAETNETPKAKTLADRWVLGELFETIKVVDGHMANYNFSLAAEALNDFTWNKLADWYLEAAKIEKGKEAILAFLLRQTLILWHPFLPFVTEAIWQSFNNSLLLVARWPEIKPLNPSDPATDFNLIQEVVVAIRNARSANRVNPAKKLPAIIRANEGAEVLLDNSLLICGLKTGLSSLSSESVIPSGAIAVPVGKVEIFLLDGIDAEKEATRLDQGKNDLERLIHLQEQKLANKEFVSKAPKAIVFAEEEKLARYRLELGKVKENLNKI